MSCCAPSAQCPTRSARCCGAFAEAWKTANASFLLVLFAGILTSILSLARLITYLLEAHPIPVWSFFFGLILVSVHLVGKEIQRRNLSRLVSFCLGIGFAYWITVAAPVQWGSSSLSLFFAGAIAICAMILPGIPAVSSWCCWACTRWFWGR